jgi:DNA-binding IclR family transcriptional regulator
MSAAAETETSSSIQVLARAAGILRLLNSHPAGLSQADIGDRLGLARSTVSRLLAALDAEGLVASQGARGRYRLGPELVRLASAARRSAWLDLHPLLAEFSYVIGETVDLSVLEGDRAVFVDQVVADNRLRAVSAVGDSFPLHASANGKAMLAVMPEADVRRVMSRRLEGLTPHTMTTPGDLRSALDTIRANHGIAFDREEQSIGVCAVGVVIGTIDHDMLAVSIPVPTQRFLEREAELREALLTFIDQVDAWIAARESR